MRRLAWVLVRRGIRAARRDREERTARDAPPLLRSLQAHGLALKDAIAVCKDVNRTRCAERLGDKDWRVISGASARMRYWPTFVRSPKSGWDLAAALLELGLSPDAALVAVRSVTPEASTRRSAHDAGPHDPGTSGRLHS